MGFSGRVGTGTLARAVAEATALAGTDPNLPGDPGTNEPYARGALVSAALATGVAPFVGARVGLGGDYEAGLAYTGRGARVDARRSVPLARTDGGHVYGSAGLGGSAVFYGRAQGGSLPAVDLGALRGWGADVPLLVGWESDAGLYRVWGGARGAWEHAVLSPLASEPKIGTLQPPTIRLEGDRYAIGGVLGLAVGFRRVHVAMEVEVGYQAVVGTYNGTRASAAGLALTPASALWFQFD